jgi:hypothetical protein
MSHYQLFPLLLIGCLAYAFALGGAPERLGALIMLLGTLATFLVARPAAMRFSHIEWGIAAVDVTALVAFLVLALVTTRHWPQWIAALQILQVASHFAATGPGTIRLVYAMAIALLAYPMLALIAAGTTRHWLRRRANGTDPSWRRLSRRSAGPLAKTSPPHS